MKIHIQLLDESLTPYNTKIICHSLPKFIRDRQGRLFQKAQTIHDAGQARMLYSEVLVANLSSIEVMPAIEVNEKAS